MIETAYKTILMLIGALGLLLFLSITTGTMILPVLFYIFALLILLIATFIFELFKGHTTEEN